MYYVKKIDYLDYYEDGIKQYNVGFVKIELRDNNLRVDMKVQNMRSVSEGQGEVYLCSEKEKVHMQDLFLKDGGGSCSFETKLPIVHQNGMLSYEDLTGILIVLNDGHQIGTGRIANSVDKHSVNKNVIVKEPEGIEDKLPEVAKNWNLMDSKEREEKQPSKTERATAEQKNHGNLAGEVKGEASVEKQTGAQTEQRGMRIEQQDIQIGDEQSRQRTEQEGIISEEKHNKEQTMEAPQIEINRNKKNMNKKAIVRLEDDKWSQLSAIYPHFMPFDDERDYLSITPSDFVILTQEAYKVANNSFLLHGYYNYRHLLLACIRKHGEAIYYLGVPGNYYDREKQVAVMFGFESFECAEEPAQQGDFGYYMLRISI